ncbi:hypothetical protein [uncultured Fluviicola sp.]|uniref:hypothetical protein n=1 Tax=uncultured Fluviicola sp. TaxID=463303 RepID=UPI0025E4F9DA|nr:hypothetical protein [uncultured Fluviicola sp.]
MELLLTDIRLSPLPDAKLVLDDIKDLEAYLELYWHFSRGEILPFDFPQKHMNRFPDRSYKQLLMTDIANKMNTINTYLAIQNEYLKNYYVLYLHYANGMDIPSDFPEEIIDQFPSRTYIHQLKGAMTVLQQEINSERAAM